MIRKHQGLLYKFASIFVVFILVTIVFTGVATYRNQMNVYRTQKLENLQYVAEYLSDILKNGNLDFIKFQEYYVKNRDKFLVPHDFSDEKDALLDFELLFNQRYPGKILEHDISFDELDDDVKLSYALYIYEFYLLTFENTCKAFDLAYTYYLIPDEEPEHIFYMLDGVRKVNTLRGKDYILIGRTADVKRSEHPVLWEAWDTGKRPDDFGVWDNDYGHDYSCYYPLVVNGQKLGIIGTEIEVSDANREIFRNSLRQILIIGLILIFMVILLLLFINRFYISRMIFLQADVKAYAEHKNPSIAKHIKDRIHGTDEISSLAMQISSMIYELENYMHNLLETTKELHDTKRNAAEMNALANKDALTGIRNKTAYDTEVERLNSKINSKNAHFGLCMIDLNFLKRINDTYGHKKGDIAIKKLCKMVCDIFEHSPVFRIGGDEFVVILENSDLKNIDTLIIALKEKLSALQNLADEWERVSAAIGVAFYDSAVDAAVDDVFKRADMDMYKNKKEMKALRED